KRSLSFMMILITIVHVLACIVLVLVVLLQAGKGADMGAVFGGASTTIFGSSGAGNFLTRLTTGAAIVFMATSLALTYGGTRSVGSTIMPENAAAPVRQEKAADVAEGGQAGVAPGAAGDAANEAGDENQAPEAGDEPAPAQDAAPAPAAP